MPLHLKRQHIPDDLTGAQSRWGRPGIQRLFQLTAQLSTWCDRRLSSHDGCEHTLTWIQDGEVIHVEDVDCLGMLRHDPYLALVEDDKERAFRKLAQCRADIPLLMRTLFDCLRDPFADYLESVLQIMPLQEFRQRCREICELASPTAAMRSLLRSPHITANLKLSLICESIVIQDHVLDRCEPIWTALSSTKFPTIVRPCLPALERACGWESRRGPPSQELSSLVMVMLIEHFRDQTDRPHYADVGYVAQIWFPGCIRLHTRQNADLEHYSPTQRLRNLVKDRYDQFKRKLPEGMSWP
jgi:hypothetical protein